MNEARKPTPIWIMFALSGVSVLIAVLISFTTLNPWLDWSLIGFQFVLLGVIIGLGIRNGRIFAARNRAIRSRV